MHAAPPEFVGRAYELLAGPHPAAPERYPFQLGNRRRRHSMNSWLNELPGLHPAGRSTEVLIHPDDAAAAGIDDGGRVRVFSAVAEVELIAHGQRPAPAGVAHHRPRVGVARVRSPRRRCAGVLRRQPQSAGRPDAVDPLSQTSALSSAYVGIARIN